MTDQMIATTRRLTNGNHRIELNGSPVVKSSRRPYTWLSVYRSTESGELVAWPHTRQDLAARGNADAEWGVDRGRLVKVAIVELVEVAA